MQIRTEGVDGVTDGFRGSNGVPRGAEGVVGSLCDEKKEGGNGPCRLQGIKTSEIYSGTDWSGSLARFGVASTVKRGAILLVTSKEGADYRGDA